MPCVDLLVRSYFRDLDLLRGCLSAIDRYLQGYRSVHVVMPRSTIKRVDVTWIQRHRNSILHECEDFNDDYVGQQVTKLHADAFTDAAYVLLVDSDHRFVEPCDLRGQLFDPSSGRLRYMLGRASARQVHDGWRQCASRFFKRAFDADLAGPLPLAVPAKVFTGLRADAMRIHGTTLKEYALSLRGDQLCEAALFAGWLKLHSAQEVAFSEDDGKGLLTACITPWSRSATRDVFV